MPDASANCVSSATLLMASFLIIVLRYERTDAFEKRRKSRNRKVTSKRNEPCTQLDLADQTGVHFLVDPGLVNRGGRQKNNEVCADTEPLIDLPAQTVSGPDLPVGPPGFNAVAMQVFGNALRKVMILPPETQKRFMTVASGSFDQGHSFQILDAYTFLNEFQEVCRCLNTNRDIVEGCSGDMGYRELASRRVSNRRDPLMKVSFDLFNRRGHQGGGEIVGIEWLTVKRE